MAYLLTSHGVCGTPSLILYGAAVTSANVTRIGSFEATSELSGSSFFIPAIFELQYIISAKLSIYHSYISEV